jgi:hypothetical protein
MNRYFPVIFILSTILFASCYNKPENIDGKNMIPSKDLVNILTDVHLAGGILNLPTVRRRFVFKDSVSNYVDIIEKYGYTKDQMDNTMKYYFVNKPRQLQEIYDKVLSDLSEMDTQIDSELPKPTEPVKNLWEGKLTYSLPNDGVKEKVWFDIPVKDTGTYVFSASIMVYPDDKSIDPAITVFFWKDNGTPDGTRDYWSEVTLSKDEVLHNYSLSKKLTDSTYTRLRGWLFDHKPQTGIWEKHMRAESIIVTKKQLSNQP